MDAPQTPPSTSVETYTEPWAALAAPPSGDTPPAGEALPPAPPDESAATEPAGPSPDPWTPDFSSEEWSDLAQDAGMDMWELQSAFSPAREVTATFGGPELEGLLNSDDPVFGSIGNNAEMIRALGSFGETLRVYVRDEAQLMTELTTLASQRGQSFTPPTIEPLAGKALDAAVDQLLSRHLRNTGARQGFASSGVFTHPVVRSMLERMARQEHRAVQSLTAMDALRRQWQAQRQQGGAMPTPASNQPSSTPLQVSKEDLDLQADELWLQWREASQAGDMVKADVFKRKLAEVDRRRFGG